MEEISQPMQKQHEGMCVRMQRCTTKEKARRDIESPKSSRGELTETFYGHRQPPGIPSAKKRQGVCHVAHEQQLAEAGVAAWLTLTESVAGLSRRSCSSVGLRVDKTRLDIPMAA